MKRIIKCLLITILILGTMCFPICAEDENKCGDNAYWSIENGTLTITGTGGLYDCEYNTNTAPWKDYVSSINKVVISEGITNTGSFTFRKMSNCTELQLPSTLKEIGNSVFSGMNISYVTIPRSVTSIGWSAFYGTSLKEVTIPSSLKVITKSAFQECYNLTSVTIENGVTTIGPYAFSMCPSLSEIEFPSSVVSLGTDPFETNNNIKVYLSCNSKLTSQDLKNAKLKNYESKHTSLYHKDYKESTCMEEGHIEYWECDDCGKCFSDKELKTEINKNATKLEKVKHELKQVKAKEPTCLEDGNIEYYECKKCKSLFTDADCKKETKPKNVVLEKTGHKVKHLDKKESTCDEKGNIECWICEKCNKYFSDDKCSNEIDNESVEIKELGHKLIHHEYTKPTLKSEGNIEYWECENCHKYYLDSDSVTEAKMSEIVIPKTPIIKVAAIVIIPLLVISLIIFIIFKQKKKKEESK